MQSPTSSEMEVVHNTTNNMDVRPEERWHESVDRLAREWADFCGKKHAAHEKAGYGARAKHVIFGLPMPIVTIIVSVVTPLWDSSDSKYFVAPATGLAGIFGAIHTFLNMGGVAQRHWDYAARFNAIKSKIDRELARDIDFRRPADEFMAETRVEIGNLEGTAPQLPGRCCGCLPPLKEEEEQEEDVVDLEAQRPPRAARSRAQASREAYVAAQRGF